MLFIPVPEGKTAKNRLHLDLSPETGTRDELVDAAVAAGASDHRRPPHARRARLGHPHRPRGQRVLHRAQRPGARLPRPAPSRSPSDQPVGGRSAAGRRLRGPGDSMRAQSPAARASAGVSQEPPTQPTFGRARYAGADGGGDPAGRAEPGGRDRRRRSTSGTPSPPDASAGKNFISVKPASSTASTSETVAVPGRNGRPVSGHRRRAASGVVPGETRNCAPASSACFACPGVTTVPAPTRISGTSSAIARIASSATGVRRVSSITGRPPATSARASGHGRGDVVDDDDRDHRDQVEQETQAGWTTGTSCCGASYAGKTLAPASAGADGGAERGEQLAAGAGPLRRPAARGRSAAARVQRLGAVEVEQPARRRRR